MTADEIIKKLFTIQRSKRITKEALSAQIGIATSNLTRWDKGQSMPRFDSVMAMAQALGCTITFDHPDIL